MAAVAGDALTPGGKPVSVFHVADEMRVLGWYLQPQLGFGASPANLHFSLQPGNTAAVGPMLADLQIAVQRAAQLPSGELAAQIGGLFAEGIPEGFGVEAVG